MFGVCANAFAKSMGVGLVRLESSIDPRAWDRKCSMNSSTCDRNISRADSCTLSKPALTSAVPMLFKSWPCAKTGSCDAGSMYAGLFCTCWSAWIIRRFLSGIWPWSLEEECGRFEPASCGGGVRSGTMMLVAMASISAGAKPASSPVF